MTTLTRVETTTVADAVAEAQAFLDAAAEIGDTHDLIAYYTLTGPRREVALNLSTVRALLAAQADAAAGALRDAAQAWEDSGFETHDAPDLVLWLRARAEGCSCGEPQACTACGAVLCPDCQVGEPARCDHGNGPFCIGCDVEACAGCCRELAMERTFAGRFL